MLSSLRYFYCFSTCVFYIAIFIFNMVDTKDQTKNGSNKLCNRECREPDCEAICSGEKSNTFCNGAYCIANTTGRYSNSSCQGGKCHSICRKEDCTASCIGGVCSTTCEGKRCHAFCKGGVTQTRCNGEKCYAECTGGACVSESNGTKSHGVCKGDACFGQCEGDSCIANCTGEDCISTCNGANCLAVCSGSRCQKESNNQGKEHPHAYDDNFEEHVHETPGGDPVEAENSNEGNDANTTTGGSNKNKKAKMRPTTTVTVVPKKSTPLHKKAHKPKNPIKETPVSEESTYIEESEPSSENSEALNEKTSISDESTTLKNTEITPIEASISIESNRDTFEEKAPAKVPIPKKTKVPAPKAPKPQNIKGSTEKATTIATISKYPGKQTTISQESMNFDKTEPNFKQLEASKKYRPVSEESATKHKEKRPLSLDMAASTTLEPNTDTTGKKPPAYEKLQFLNVLMPVSVNSKLTSEAPTSIKTTAPTFEVSKPKNLNTITKKTIDATKKSKNYTKETTIATTTKKSKDYTKKTITTTTKKSKNKTKKTSKSKRPKHLKNKIHIPKKPKTKQKLGSSKKLKGKGTKKKTSKPKKSKASTKNNLGVKKLKAKTKKALNPHKRAIEHDGSDLALYLAKWKALTEVPPLLQKLKRWSQAGNKDDENYVSSCLSNTWL